MQAVATVWFLSAAFAALYMRAALDSYQMRGASSLFFPRPVLALSAARPAILSLAWIGVTAVPCALMARLSHEAQLQGISHAYALTFVVSTTIASIHGSANLWMGRAAVAIGRSLTYLAQGFVAFSAAILWTGYFLGIGVGFTRLHLDAQLPVWSILGVAGATCTLGAIAVLAWRYAPNLDPGTLQPADLYERAAKLPPDPSPIRFVSWTKLGYTALVCIGACLFAVLWPEGRLPSDTSIEVLVRVGLAMLALALGLVTLAALVSLPWDKLTGSLTRGAQAPPVVQEDDRKIESEAKFMSVTACVTTAVGLGVVTLGHLTQANWVYPAISLSGGTVAYLALQAWSFLKGNLAGVLMLALGVGIVASFSLGFIGLIFHMTICYQIAAAVNLAISTPGFIRVLMDTLRDWQVKRT